jgi:hypothetical protein
VSAYLLPIADREPLVWIVAAQRTAFATHRARDAARLQAGDRLFLYTARGCFHNPTRDRGRVAGLATVRAEPAPLAEPVRFGEREYALGLDLAIDVLAPPRGGVELAPLVPELDSFPNKDAWSATMRRSLVPLTDRDAERLERELRPLAAPYADAAAAYAA